MGHLASRRGRRAGKERIAEQGRKGGGRGAMIMMMAKIKTMMIIIAIMMKMIKMIIR